MRHSNSNYWHFDYWGSDLGAFSELDVTFIQAVRSSLPRGLELVVGRHRNLFDEGESLLLCVLLFGLLCSYYNLPRALYSRTRGRNRITCIMITSPLRVPSLLIGRLKGGDFTELPP
jgi:hypothetical protein